MRASVSGDGYLGDGGTVRQALLLLRCSQIYWRRIASSGRPVHTLREGEGGRGVVADGKTPTNGERAAACEFWWLFTR